ncbi:CBASS cGAMP synthase, partial [Vibrio coralliirubri]|uniref:CBASS cGAMP synthase n=1 Tax=Vibrio coralliirubri TaxID=1516159 RepID=UPI002FD0CB25
REYRRDVRAAIRAAFSKLRDAFEMDRTGNWQLRGEVSLMPLAEHLRKLTPSQKHALATLKPKFMSQGSFVYKTLNLPCHNPPQQIDLDDGVYLPLEVFQESPIISKDVFFAIVDSSLKTLASSKGWAFKEKNTCARLVVSDLIHIDVPLYAIPEQRYLAMESIKANVNHSDSEWFADSRSLLNKNEIYLAVRNRESWINSDPATISEWFKEQVRFHGVLLRNVCRHLKAWRDYQFTDGGPSSIALMACAVQTFNNEVATRGKKFTSKQESEALMLCANKLKAQLTQGVDNPVDASKPQLYPSGLTQQEISEQCQAAHDFAEEISFSLKMSQTKQQSVDSIRKLLGDRVPNRQDLIIVANNTVLSHPPKTTPAPVVPNGEAG